MTAALAYGVMAFVAPVLGVLAEFGSEGGDGFWLLLAGPAAGGGVYWAIYVYYRNTDKSHQFERDTHIESQPVTGRDDLVQEIRGTKRSSISGNNVHDHRQRVQRLR